MVQALKSPLMTQCSDCAIRHRAICAYCGPDDLAKLNAMKSYRTFPKGAEVVAAGERSPVVGTVVNGVIALSKTLVDGRRQLVGLQFQSDFVGGAYREEARCDATAVSEVLVCQFERNAFERLMEASPELRARFLDLALDELDAAREWLTLLGQKTAREKVATFLAMIARRQRDAAPGARVIAELPITRSEIGEYLGLTIETVSRQLSKLKSERVIDFKSTRVFEVADLTALQEAAGELS